MAHTRKEGDALNTVKSKEMHLPRKDGKLFHSNSCTCPSSKCILHPIPEKPSQSSYLKSFMFDSSSDDDNNQSSVTPRQITTKHPFNCDSHPTHPAKRRRTTSSGSNSDNGDKQRSGAAITPRHTSESAKSGTVCGTFGNKPDRSCYRPKFPSDDLEDLKETVKSTPPPAHLGNNTSKEISTLTDKFLSDSPERETSIKSTNSSRSTSPKVEEAAQFCEEMIEPFVRSRPERSAATKAQELIKNFAPKVKDSDIDSDTSNDSGVPKYKLDSTLLQSLVIPLQIGYRLYSQLRNDPNLRHDLAPFLEPVDAARKSTQGYYKKIEKPMCLTKIEEKLANLNYFSTAEIVGDIRLMLENCYKFNGVDSWISKQACKIEVSLEHRITLLPYSMKGKCSLTETSPHLTLCRDVCGRRNRTPVMYAGCSKSPIMIALEEIVLYKEKEGEMMQVQKSRRHEAIVQDRVAALASFVTNSAEFERVTSSWEFISSCLMICVCQEEFDLQFSVGALELALLYPKHSRYLAKLMVCLSASGSRIRMLKKQDKISYDEWSSVLAGRVRYWYQVTNKHGPRLARTQTGVTEEMYNTFGTYKTPLQTIDPENPANNGRLFHELSIGERLTLIHTLCTSKMTMCPRLQNCFLEYESESLRPTLLGKDGLGNALFHFPLWPEEVRVYMEICPTENNSDYPNTDYIVHGEVRCVSRNTDDLLSLIEKLQSSGVLHSPTPVKRSAGSNKRILIRAADALVKTLQILHEELSPHQAHYLLVETTIYKELAEGMTEEDPLKPVSAPRTPPRPFTPTPNSSPSQEEDTHVILEDERESSLEKDAHATSEDERESSLEKDAHVTSEDDRESSVEGDASVGKLNGNISN